MLFLQVRASDLIHAAQILVLERERERLVILDLNLLEFVILINLIKLLGCFLGWRLVSLL